MTESEPAARKGLPRAISVPYFRPSIGSAEIDEVVACLQSGWMTTGPRVRRFEEQFAEAVGAEHAVAVNSCTAALHLAVDALGLRDGDAVLVPTMTFAATAEVVRYQRAVPILVDCDERTGNVDLEDAAEKLGQRQAGHRFTAEADSPHGTDSGRVVGMLPVHVGGYMVNPETLDAFAARHDLWIVEDAAHAFPAAWRSGADAPWRRCGDATSRVACFSFYANKTITTGEGGMAVTNDRALADRMRMMSLHGLSRDAWDRYSGGGWDYRIVAPGYKYNLTDIAASIGLGQLQRAEQMRREREAIAHAYLDGLASIDEIELPVHEPDRLHSWHLFPIRLRLERLAIDRDTLVQQFKAAGVSCSVHWRPLHLHPYYQETMGYSADSCPTATRLWRRLISLPIFSGMRTEEIDHVIDTVTQACARHRRPLLRGALA